MNLRQIEAFKAVMETGTVTQAAARLHVSQPALSKLLQAFERGVSLVLFSRERGRLTPTTEARLLYEEVDRVFQGAEKVRVAAEAIRGRQRGVLAIGVMPALSTGFAQEILARMSLASHGVQVTIEARDTPRLVEQLVTHQIELFYSAHPVEHPEISIETLCRLSLVCILPPGHHLASRAVIRCEDLEDEPFATLRRASPTRRLIDDVFARQRVRMRVALEAPMAPTLCAFVARGLGVALVDPLYVGAFAAALVVRPFVPAVGTEVFLALPRRRLSLVAAAYVEASRHYVAELAAGQRVLEAADLPA